MVVDIRPHLGTENRTEAELALKKLPTIEQQWVGLSKNQVTVSHPRSVAILTDAGAIARLTI
ncbi:hypothetical protein QUA56_15575 [Microcoleus sp. N3A4]|uniref:hypothetical protein n=1 Tax=Microcoleus sp. N3A4 TaxID=3055379 RepID=UPI002FD6F042